MYWPPVCGSAVWGTPVCVVPLCGAATGGGAVVPVSPEMVESGRSLVWWWCLGSLIAVRRWALMRNSSMIRLHNMQKLEADTVSEKQILIWGIVSLQSNEEPRFNCVLLATVARGGERGAASVVAPAQWGKDECHEPEVAEDKVERCQDSPILGEAWCNRSDKINDHRNDSLATMR